MLSGFGAIALPLAASVSTGGNPCELGCSDGRWTPETIAKSGSDPMVFRNCSLLQPLQDP
jgi:hypothetical protein